MNSLPGTSRIVIRPSAPFTHSTRTHSSAVICPFAPDGALGRHRPVALAAFLLRGEVRSLSGQSGQTSALFSCTGGFGRISSWVTEAAPWRLEVPMQSEPVSPPPITTTCLPLAVIVPSGAARCFGIAGHALVLLGEEIHGEMDAVQLAAGTSRSRGASAPPDSTTAS